MASPSSSASATANSTSSQASPAKSSSAGSTSKAQITSDSASSQTVGENQDPTPSVSSTSESSSAARSPTSSGAGDVTTATGPTPESTASTTTHTQIALPSHKTDSDSAAPTASDSGVSSSSFSPSISQGHTQSSSDVSIPLPLPPTPTSVTPSLTPISKASLPPTTVSILSTRINALPAPPSTVPSSSQPILTTHVQGTVASGGSGASTSPIASPTSPSVTPSDNGSKASAIAQASNRNSPITTSTVTDKPETTLSSPVFFTVTDAQNRTTISEPPVFTSVEVTTSNGEQVSVTHVIANPTGIWGVDEATSSHGFFSNSGAVAGVFLVVGLVIAAIFAGIYLYFRRRRRQRAPHFIESISRPLPMPDDPFEDPRTLLPPPEMHYASGYADRTLVIAGAATPHPTPSRSPFDSDLDHASLHSSEAHRSGEQVHGLGLAGAGARGKFQYGDSSQSSLHSRSGQATQRGPVGLAITTDIRPDSASSARREPSSAQSSPSIYPPSLPTPSGEDDYSSVNIPLSNNNGTTRFANVSATRLSSPTTRKPVPLHDLPEPVAPVARSPQQQQAEQTRPPVIPPRSPLRRNSTATSRSLSRSPPPFRLSSIQTQLKNPELANAALLPYEPLTPPTSLASLSPAGSSSGHEALTPISPADAIAAANPFSDAHAQQAPHAGIITAFPMTRSGDKRETFYTRTRGSQRRPSVEWRQRD
ncbi:hypothetical protein V8D89_010131 [Ganoderma adspersum]